MLCNVTQMQKQISEIIIEGTLDQKLSVFSPIYFPASSYPVFVFLSNNHGCLSVMQSLQYKNLCKAVSERELQTRLGKVRPKLWSTML